MIQLVETIKEAIQDKKGCDIVVADLTKIEGTICQYFMICTGNSPTQVEAIAESIGDVVREKLGEKPAHVVGLECSCPTCAIISIWSICGKMPL